MAAQNPGLVTLLPGGYHQMKQLTAQFVCLNITGIRLTEKNELPGSWSEKVLSH